jgi:excisionase family DNA binding protein
MMTRQTVEPTIADSEQLQGVIKRYKGRLSLARLIGPDQEVIDLPESVNQILVQVVYAMSRGLAVAVVPLHKELTSQEAADYLNVSRQYLVQLLDQGAIPHTKVGKHRRVRFGDLHAYKEARDRQRGAGLAELARLSDELGLYDKDFPRE